MTLDTKELSELFPSTLNQPLAWKEQDSHVDKYLKKKQILDT